MNDDRRHQYGNRSSRLTVVAIAVLLITGLGVWGGLMLGGLRELRTVSAFRADPLDLPRLTEILNASESPLILLGDSRVSQWNPLPGFDSQEFVRLGSSGMTAVQMDLVARLLANRVSGSTVVVQVGINDLKSIGYMDRSSDEIIAETQRALAGLHDTLTRNGAQVFITTIVPPGPVSLARRFVWSEEVRDAVLEVNEALTTGDLMPEHAVIDFGAELGSTREAGSEYVTDTLHLNPSGYERLNAILTRRLSSRDLKIDAF